MANKKANKRSLDTILPTERQSFQEHTNNFDQKDQMVMISFPDVMPAELAAAFLTFVDVIAIIPVINSQKQSDKSENLEEYVFTANKNSVVNFIEHYDSNEKIYNNPVIMAIISALNNGEYKMGLTPLKQDRSARTLAIQKTLQEYKQKALDSIENMRDKINFIYSLSCDNISTGKSLQHPLKNEEIFKNFILHIAAQIESAKTLKEKENLINKLLFSVMLTKKGMEYNLNKFKNFGVLKNPTNPSMEVMLDNGEHADLFALNMSKEYRIMNSVNISKINSSVDFSNIKVNGDFICANAKKIIIFPKQINGLLDCSYCCDDFITSTTRIPHGTKSINFTGVIKNFENLANIVLPKSVTEILLANSTINTTLKNANALQDFYAFAKKYPNIKIWDTKHKVCLQDVLSKQEQEKQIQQTQTTTKPQVNVPKQPQIQEKTAEWLTRKEILALIEQDSDFSDIDGLDRFIKRATNSNAVIKPENRLLDGNMVSCVHINCIPTIKEGVLQIIEENVKRAKPKAKVVEKQERIVKQQTQKQVKSARIKKYIPKQIWKNICNSCGNSFQLLYSVLDDINKVNNSYDTQTATNTPIQYIDNDGNWQCITNTEYKGKKAATQWISKRDNRRIVWTINSGVMVAIEFFEDHVNNAKSVISYREALANAKKGLLMDGKTVVDKTLVKSNDFLNVSDLLTQYKITKTEKKQEEKQPVKTVKQTKTQPQTDAEQQKQVIVEQATEPVTAPVVRAKRPRIRTQVDVKSLEIEIAAFIKGLDAKINELAVKMCRQKNNSEKQLKTLKEIEHYIQEKINLQR